MKRFVLVALLLATSTSLVAQPLGTSARTVIPSEVQQIISVDYRALKASPTAIALKERVLPENLKQFENALRSFGVNPDKDIEQLTFASFRTPQKQLRVVGIAQGTFPAKAFLKKMALKKIKGSKYRTSVIWPMAGGMQMSFLDSYTLLFGELSAVKFALDARDGETQSLAYNQQIADLIGGVESGPVWSVLDQPGTQNMMRSALGDAARLGDYDVVKKRLLGSSYTMSFENGVNFDLNVSTSDTITAATLSSLVKAGMMYKRMTASSVEKSALEGVSVNSDSDRLQLHFKSDDKKFQSLLSTDLFAAVSR
ncbi:MAG TPA: hypothetical protein VD837_12180 [Terriglobales bacterium]|nr:hypothetical protein [Terriglobales bacterium]